MCLHTTNGDTHGIMTIIVENGLNGRVQVLGKDICISHRTNTLKKGVNSTILPPTIGMATSLREGKI